MKLKQLEKSGIEAIKSLREHKLKNGQPFMINSKTLPSDQCYMEYPDGSIALVAFCRKTSDFKIIGQFSNEEETAIRKKYQLN